MKFPFSLTSKKDKKNVEAEVPKASTEVPVPSSLEVNGVNIDVDSKLSGDISVSKPAAVASLDAEPSVTVEAGIAGMEMPELALISPETKAKASANAALSDAQINVGVGMPSEQLSASGLLSSVDTNLDVDARPSKVEGSLPGADMTSPTLKLEAPLAEVDMPSVNITENHADVQSPKLDVDGKLEVDADKDVGDIALPSVSAKVDIPQLNADHKVAGDMDFSAPTKDGKKKSKIKFPFKLSSKKGKKNAEAEIPNASVEVPSSPEVNGIDMGMDSKLSGDLSVAKPAVTVSLDAEPSASLEAGNVIAEIPEAKTDASLDASLPDPHVNVNADGPRAAVSVPRLDDEVSVPVHIELQPGMPFEQHSVTGLLPSVDTNLDVDAGPGKVEGSLPGVDSTLPTLKSEAPLAEIDMPSVVDTGIHADVKRPEVDASVDTSLPDVSFKPEVEVPVVADDLKTPADVDVARDIEMPTSDIKSPPISDLDVQPPEAEIFAKTAVPAVTTKMPSDDHKAAVNTHLSGDLTPPEAVAAVKLDGDLDGSGAGAEIPEVQSSLPETKAEAAVDVGLPDVLPDSHVNVNADGPSAEVTVPRLDGDVSVPVHAELEPGILENPYDQEHYIRSRRSSSSSSDRSDAVPEVRPDQDVGVDLRFEPVDDDIIVAKSKGQLHSQPPPVSFPASDDAARTSPVDGTDEDLVGGGWFDLEPSMQVERRVERSEALQRHGYAVLVTAAMLKLGAVVHDELENGNGTSSQTPDDQNGGSRRSSSSGSSDEPSSKYYYNGMDNAAELDSAGDGHFVNGDDSKYVDDEQPLASEKRLLQDDTSQEIAVTANIRRTTADDNDASEA